MQKTLSKKPRDVKVAWKLIDASGRSLGRLASEVAQLLRGKHQPDFTPHVAGGDGVVVIHSDKVVLTGKKWTDKKYYRHTPYVGSLKEWRAKDLPTEELIRKSVAGMLPKNKMRQKLLKKLRVYKNAEHKQEAQNPKDTSL